MNALRLKWAIGLYFLVHNIWAQNIGADSTSEWKGSKRHDLQFEGRTLRVIEPREAAFGNPWLWRARFPDWHTEQDSILVAEGFHLVYVDTDNLYGSPKAMAIWNDVYDFVRSKYGLSEKPALSGVSRGGLFVYNWAKLNPKKVSCIYAEAPVCDFKSWPGGFGKGRGSKDDWEKLMKAYGFRDEAEAKGYEGQPIDGLEALAAQKVPILHTIGLHDEFVPAEENTFILVDRYLKLGGPASIVPCTQGKQELNGHHFPIESPRLVADFVKYNASHSGPLSSRPFYNLRNGLKNSYIKFEHEKKGTVAFLGGSITFNPGWRDSVMLFLEKRFPDTEFKFIAAGIPSMGSVPGAFRMERDVLSQGPIDLLFEEAAVNDATNGRSDEEQKKAMEGIVRHLRKENPSADMVLFHFVDPDKIADYNQGKVPEVIVNHEAVAEHYGLPSLNLAKEVTMRIANGEFTWEDDFKNLHPSPFGQQVYAKAMIDMLETAYLGHLDADDKRVQAKMPKALVSHPFEMGELLPIQNARLSKGWEIVDPWSPNDGKSTRPNYTDVPMLIATEPGAKLKYKFTGNAAGIAVAAGQDAGTIQYRIDKGDWQIKDLFTQWSAYLHLPWYYVLAYDLDAGEHELELKVSDRKNPHSTGHAVRIRYFFQNAAD
ncbi:SGNH/GDSL hydrolase family protein [Marinilongibacter aquaticus]|uniref:SGNH/GDSL hydrolase family protein n=1 Tax=Marinilongibacter aquaticus TaxID=2975157 RepID=UPI0021BD437F|nr:SGNH/GDSL hydrolase family protein [Marinilongibacter aquaticus]UBM59050.1 SGNH/GDSL hydrolase family protein [Marinilongibacter aquaticus]